MCRVVLLVHEISTVNYQEKLTQACSLDGHRTNRQTPCADALYHSQWNINFRAKKKKKSIPLAFRRSTELQNAGVQKGRPVDIAWAEAFTQVVRYCAENDEQITIIDLCEMLNEYLNGDTPYTKKYVRMKLESHFGEDVILTGIRGKRSVVTSRSNAEKILELFLKSAKEKDGGGGGGGDEAYK